MKEEDIFQQSKQVWEENLKLFPASRLNFPDENLVRLFSGRYVSVPEPPAKVMDHGFGHANNLIYLVTKGYECGGCEISKHLIDEARKLFESMGHTVDLKPIVGLEIPFDDECFDVVVSWNVLHYNGTYEAVLKVISELHRVLKSGGVLLLSTLHHDNGISSRMKHLGGGSYLIERESEHDNRQGLTFFSTQSEEELAGLFSQFSKVKTGKVFFDLFNNAERHAASLIYAVK
ncbi:MAG: class I SAM-dependent methyltransferase [Phycisphaerales bacterium]|nr:MAG: class I SAM-dependent methyltransferase [Phycisphaerales bacterium]